MYLTQSLHRALQQRPDALATIYGERTRTVAESADRVARFAGALRGLGVGKGDRVGILALNSDRYHEYYIAVPWLGAVVNPVNIRWSPAEIVYSLRDSGTTTLLVDDMFAQALPAILAEYPLEHVVFIGDGERPDGTLDYETLVAESDPAPDTRTGGAELLGLFYTGGTTGFPKGVMLSHDNVVTSALGALATTDLATRHGRLLHAAPMFHLADYAAWNIGNVLGATHVIVPVFTPPGVLKAMAEHRVTDSLLVPTMIQMLVDDPGAAEHDLSGLRRVLYGASPISEALLERAAKAFPSAEFTQAYGMTELSPIATLLTAEDHRRPELRRAAGRAVAHAEVRVVDPDGNEVPRGTVGEIVVKGDNVMLGYWNKPEETAAAVVDGWMHTGDGGYMDEAGYVFVVDRLKDMIVTGGENVYSAEVENALAKHPAVAQCAVIGIPDADWGERVHAVVVLAPGRTATAEELGTHCKSLIANYKIPRSVEFADALPLSGAGKILKRELRKPHWEQAGRDVS
ncbi:long-chain fatty acid--CoA ligase [Nocardia puris]|uniref:Acyl-CoA synthetase (AMP-forming)/AMP-acid ligase II n=1 Tax=Nocardia puris TaxID=208602 RepID=A0A366E4S7_9NOCA|nr:long-chain fatty acid--CoA ligase [Nocardia puris]MBF6212668.1 long-chain fatty acid--CoA ligase [Nocardia puris]MBF6367606.1 long-chain fatty acid--CoA ligase [Nocardia puris]MBF6461257.1 long-chain fatty acid--CoA ligase [Nocardia puris]RBO96514.1 acyl-CoA synthetase (AMP-forming)/AMP-acid ligase II [Nocardia puris]